MNISTHYFGNLIFTCIFYCSYLIQSKSNSLSLASVSNDFSSCDRWRTKGDIKCFFLKCALIDINESRSARLSKCILRQGTRALIYGQYAINLNNSDWHWWVLWSNLSLINLCSVNACEQENNKSNYWSCVHSSPKRWLNLLMLGDI